MIIEQMFEWLKKALEVGNDWFMADIDGQAWPVGGFTVVDREALILKKQEFVPIEELSNPRLFDKKKDKKKCKGLSPSSWRKDVLDPPLEEPSMKVEEMLEWLEKAYVAGYPYFMAKCNGFEYWPIGGVCLIDRMAYIVNMFDFAPIIRYSCPRLFDKDQDHQNFGSWPSTIYVEGWQRKAWEGALHSDDFSQEPDPALQNMVISLSPEALVEYQHLFDESDSDKEKLIKVLKAEMAKEAEKGK